LIVNIETFFKVMKSGCKAEEPADDEGKNCHIKG